MSTSTSRSSASNGVTPGDDDDMIAKDKRLTEVTARIASRLTQRAPRPSLRRIMVQQFPKLSLPLPGFDVIVNDAVKMVDADDGKPVREEEFKKIMTEILGVIMFQLQGNPILVSSNSVVHEPLASASTLLVPTPVVES